MKKYVVGLIITMLLISMNFGTLSIASNYPQNNTEILTLDTNAKIGQEEKHAFELTDTLEKTREHTPINLPWSTTNLGLLEWWIRISYNGETFEKQVPINLSDFRERFLKHPEYGEIIRFNVDSDPQDDVEVIAGIYWSLISDENGKEITSLEIRCRSRLLEEGNYLSDTDGDFQLWSELHVNYGIIKKQMKQRATINHQFLTTHIPKGIKDLLTAIHTRWLELKTNIINEEKVQPSIIPSDSDSITIGVGYHSLDGEEIPRYIDKRFAFARDEIFSPTIFQHIIDPGSSKGKNSVELLYGFRAFRAGASTPDYDISFSVTFEPAVYLKTKFSPLQGLVYYYFNEESKRNNATVITFTSSILSGLGENVNLSLSFETIDDSLAYTGRWMRFDVDVLHDQNPLGGKFNYKASHAFDVGIIVNSDQFEEKMKIINFPREVEVSWDLNVQITFPPNLYAHANGYVDLSMSDDIGGLLLYYPNIPDVLTESAFIELPEGLPRSTRLEAEASLSLNTNDLLDDDNSMFGRISHECSDNIKEIEVFLPDISLPIQELDSPLLRITEIPSYAEARGTLYWNRLQGNAYLFRSTEGPADPVEVQLAYGDYILQNVLKIREGYLDMGFQLAEDGYLAVDSSKQIIGNALTVTNQQTDTRLAVSFSEVSADDFRAEWDLDTSGDKLNINDLGLSGLIDTVKDLEILLHYQGKDTTMELDWILGQTGNFAISVDQEDDLTLNFDEFGFDSSDFILEGSITLSQLIEFDMDWKWKQGTVDGGGSIDPGSFSINKDTNAPYIKHFDFYFVYKDRYGVNISFDNLWFYLDLQWWKGDRTLPYVWLDYEVNKDDFSAALLWTNAEGESQWYEHVEEW